MGTVSPIRHAGLDKNKLFLSCESQKLGFYQHLRRCQWEREARSAGLQLWLAVRGYGLALRPVDYLTNSFVGFVCCTRLYIGLYHGNVWNALSFLFLFQVCKFPVYSPALNVSQVVILSKSFPINISGD